MHALGRRIHVGFLGFSVRRLCKDVHRFGSASAFSFSSAAYTDRPASFPKSPSPLPLGHSRPKVAASPPIAREAELVTSSESQSRVNTASNEPPQDQEFRRLLLAQETHALQAPTGSVILDGSFPASAKFHDQTKSLGHLCAPQRTLFPQQWRHIFALGEPKLYNDLTFAEFTAGYLAIIEKCPKPRRRSLFLLHLADLMSLACSYQ